jgi:hypothetical protein
MADERPDKQARDFLFLMKITHALFGILFVIVTTMITGIYNKIDKLNDKFEIVLLEGKENTSNLKSHLEKLESLRRDVDLIKDRYAELPNIYMKKEDEIE